MEENEQKPLRIQDIVGGFEHAERFYVYYDRFYISMADGKAYYAGVDDGRTVIVGVGGSYIPMMHDVKGLDFETLDVRQREEFLGALARARGNIITQLERTPEAKYLLSEYGTYFLINLEPEVGLDSLTGFVTNPDPERHVAGTAHVKQNVIRMDMLQMGGFQKLWDEEVGHMLDGRIARDAPVGQRRLFLSDQLVTDSMLSNDLARVSVALNERSDNEIFDGFRRATERSSISYASRSEDVMSKDAVIDEVLQGKLAANYMRHDYSALKEKLRYILTLDSDVYDDIRDTRDGDKDNPLKDTEIMVKFHVLRGELEQSYANGGKVPDYFAVDTPAMAVLGSLVPELTAAYRDHWLPRVHREIGADERT